MLMLMLVLVLVLVRPRRITASLHCSILWPVRTKKGCLAVVAAIRVSSELWPHWLSRVYRMDSVSSTESFSNRLRPRCAILCYGVSSLLFGFLFVFLERFGVTPAARHPAPFGSLRRLLGGPGVPGAPGAPGPYQTLHHELGWQAACFGSCHLPGGNR